MAVAYKAELEALAPKVTFLMSLYLNPALTPDEIRKAAKAGVRGTSILIWFTVLSFFFTQRDHLLWISN